MTSVAIVLLIAAAALHASWNLISKRTHPGAAFFLIANTAGGLLLTPVAAWQAADMLRFPLSVWGLLAATGVFLALYYAALAAAYRAGDISVAYPLARSMPVVLVTAISFGLGRGDSMGYGYLAGIPLVITGCFLVPARRLSAIRPGSYATRTCTMALLAAVGTAGYSLVDDQALRLLRAAPALARVNRVALTLTYAWLEAASSSAVLLVFVLVRREGRRSLCQTWAAARGLAVLAGAMIYATYCTVLVSMAYVDDVGYVVAFRQLSIPLGAILGILLLREPAHRTKVFGVALMLVGLILVAAG